MTLIHLLDTFNDYDITDNGLDAYIYDADGVHVLTLSAGLPDDNGLHITDDINELLNHDITELVITIFNHDKKLEYQFNFPGPDLLSGCL